MQRSSFKRARNFGAARLDRLILYIVGAGSALITPLLILVLGLTFHLLIDRGAGEVPRDWVLGPLVGGVDTWPYFGDNRRCLVALISAGIGLSLLESLSLIFINRSVQHAALTIASRLKSAIHTQAFRLGSSDLLGAPRTRREELFTEKVELVRAALALWWRALPRSVVALAALLVLALAVNFVLTLLALVMVALVWRVYGWLSERSRNNARLQHDRAEQRHEVLLDGLHWAPLAAGYSLTETPGEEFNQNLVHYQAAAFRAHNSAMTPIPLLSLLVMCSAWLFLLVVGFNILAERPGMTMASTIVLVTALLCTCVPLARLIQMQQSLRSADEAAAEIFAYLDREPSVVQLPDARPLDGLKTGIGMEGVTIVDRDGHKLLDQVSLTIPSSSRVGILASDPQTPIALGGLFVRFYDPAAGRILFDTQDIRHATLDSLRAQAAVVPANGMMFNCSVLDNITCANPKYDALQVANVARKARAYDFILELPQGFSTVIGELNRHLDAGQAFRIALARAAIRDPAVIVVEEPPEEMDGATATAIDEALRDIAVGRTLIVLPGRLATLRCLDRIYLVHDGKLHAQGTHAELLQSSELYRHLTYVRFNPFRHKVS